MDKVGVRWIKKASLTRRGLSKDLMSGKSVKCLILHIIYKPNLNFHCLCFLQCGHLPIKEEISDIQKSSKGNDTPFLAFKKY